MKKSILKLGKTISKAQQKAIAGGIGIQTCNNDEDCPSCANTGCPIEATICYTCVFNICIGNC